MAESDSIAPQPGEEFHKLPHDATIVAHVNVSTSVTAPEQSNTTSTASRFDPRLYRQAQAVRMDESAVATRKLQTVIPVRKPSKKLFVCVHPDPEYRAVGMPTIEDEATGEIYLLAANLELPADIENKIDFLNIAAAITTDGSVFLWHYKNSTNSWSESARIATREASRRWVRVLPDKSSNGYILETPKMAPAPPTWPELSFTEMLEIAFGARYIDSLNHPLMKKLRGDFHV
jgi:hypothetical protein